MTGSKTKMRVLDALQPPGPDATPARWQQRKSARTRLRIIEAAIDCLVENGFAGLTTQAVVERTGVSRGAMHHHFPTLIALVGAVVEHVFFERMRLFLEDYLERMKDAAESERLEIATAAARARRAFGPEIRLRIFWEQIARLIVAVALYALGVRLFGLFVAHIVSLGVTAWLSVRLLGRYYDLGLLWRAPMPAALRHDTLKSGLATMPPNLARRAFNDLPPVLLGLALSGGGGAVAAGLFGIARKIASVPLIVRQTFLYVLAPLSSAQSAADKAQIAPLYRFANRIAAIIVLPLTAVMIAGGDATLLLFSPEAADALPVLIVLLVGRAGETILGAATPIVEMTGHRLLPLANSIVGLAVAGLVGWLTVDAMGATGMALAVSAGVIVSSWAAVTELWISDRLGPFDRHFLRALACGIGGFAALWLIGWLFQGLGMVPRAAIQFACFLPLVWLGLKFGLDAEDKAALGKAGRKLAL